MVERLAERSLSVYLTEGLRFEIAVALAAIKQMQGIDAAKATSAEIDNGHFTTALTDDGRVVIKVDGEVIVDRPMWRLRVAPEFGLGDD